MKKETLLSIIGGAMLSMALMFGHFTASTTADKREKLEDFVEENEIDSEFEKFRAELIKSIDKSSDEGLISENERHSLMHNAQTMTLSDFVNKEGDLPKNVADEYAMQELSINAGGIAGVTAMMACEAVGLVLLGTNLPKKKNKEEQSSEEEAMQK